MNRSKSLLVALGLGLAGVVLLLARGDGQRASAAAGGAAFERSTSAATGVDELPGAESSGDRTTIAAGARDTAASAGAPAAAEVALDAFEPDALWGTVVADASGAPIAGAAVLLFARDEDDALLAETSTDADGRYRFRNLEAFESYALRAQAAGFAAHRDSRRATGHGEEVRMRAAASLAGRVTDALTREPIEGALVAFAGSHWDGERVAERYETRTGADGRFRIEGARVDETTRVSVGRPGELPVAKTFRVVEGGRDDCDFELVRAGVLRGVVYDQFGGEPVPGAALEARGHEAEPADAEGRFALPVSALADAGEGDVVTFTVRAEGYAPTRAAVRRSSFDSWLRVPLQRFAAFEGTVCDEGGAPLEGARISPENMHYSHSTTLAEEGGATYFRDEQGRVQPVRSDAEGRYRLGELSPDGRQFQLSAEHPGHGKALETAVVPTRPGEVREVDFVLARGARVLGTVTAGGAPVSAGVGWGQGRLSGWSRTNERGEYRFDNLPVGEVLVRAWRQDVRGLRDGSSRTTLVLAAGDEQLHDFELEGAAATIAGTVRNEAGLPLSGLWVNAWARSTDAGVLGARVRTAVDGTYALEVPDVAVAFTVRAGSSAISQTLADVLPGSTGVDFTLPEAGILRIAVRDELTRTSIADVTLFWRARGSDAWRTVRPTGGTLPAPDGGVDVELPLGPIDLAVSARRRGYRTKELTATVGRRVEGNASPEPVPVDLERGTNVALVFQTDGPPLLDRFEVYLLGPTDSLAPESNDGYHEVELRSHQDVSPDDGGQASAYGLAPGRYHLVSDPPGLAIEPAVLDIPQMDTARFDVRYTAPPIPPPDPEQAARVREAYEQGLFSDY